MNIRCTGLRKSFDGVIALGNISVQCPTGGITAIIGPNGAGKTTLLNILTGFLSPDAGRWFVGEREITGLPPYKVARMGLTRTFQDVRLISMVTVLENVMLARPDQTGEGLLHAILRIGVAGEEACNQREASRLLQFVGLEKQTNERAGTLSYGQQKLLTLACCLAAQPEILLLDEPLAGVHTDTAANILRLLQQIRQNGKTVVFVEHNIAAVREIADFVIVIDEGTVVAQGPPREVLNRPEILEAYVA
ncbi:MAG: ABC transporter ATP-binding protein [Tepidisphaeraceae bacterium]|jgi:ABC-type branched-subunit amino acid transport system ATPase component